ncbi:hypothetical protein GCM10023189_08940 [Nibrella saemangeumensis]|uniref:Lysylphosphatidylglycerol synthase TM region n=1 Tax=Nibrella saemangeumensis TaxID=1084526 RepID=A0ABP8MGD1_9BACT
MQSNDLQIDSIPPPAKKILFWLKLAVLSVILAYITYTLGQQPANWNRVWQHFQQTNWAGSLALGLVLLTPVNWALEALKWKILIRRVEAVSLTEAYQGVLAGLSLGFALPAQVGDTAGRVLSLRSGRRAEGLGASLVSGGMQFYVALLFGTAAWLHQLLTVPARDTTAGRLLFGLLTSMLLAGLGLVQVRRRLQPADNPRPWLRQLTTYLQVAGQYTSAEFIRALLVASLRYLTFSLQFYMALRLYGIALPVDDMAAGIGLVFLAKTITPAFNLLSDLGVREAASLWVFAPYGVVAPLLLTATLTLWLVNVLLPVLVGLVWVWRLRWSVDLPFRRSRAAGAEAS